MAALGSALSSQLRAPAPTAWKGKKQARAKRATPVRAASTENKIEEVAAAVDPKALLPKGLYCESHHQAIRRPTRCVASKTDPRAREIATRRASHPIFFSSPAATNAELLNDRLTRSCLPLALHPQDRHRRRCQARLRAPHRPPDHDHLRHSRCRGHRRRGPSPNPPTSRRSPPSYPEGISSPDSHVEPPRAICRSPRARILTVHPADHETTPRHSSRRR